MKNILVTIDFDKNIDLLIDKAFELANSLNSKIWLMHIAAPDPDFIGYGVGPQYIRDSRAKELKKEHKKLQEYARKLQNKGVKTEALLIQGSTVETIIKKSEKLNIDLIIVGHHEHGFLFNVFAESVSAQIIKKSKIPLLIVPID